MTGKIILGSVIGVAGVSILNAVQNHTGISKILAGAYILLLLLSLLDLFGGMWARFAAGFATIIFFGVLITQGPWNVLSKLTVQPNVPSGTLRPPTNTRGPQQS